MAVRTKRLLDFGPDLPVTVSPEAKERLNKLPQPAIRELLEGLRDWAKDAPVKAARAWVFTDPEVDDSSEVEIELLVDTNDDDEAFALLDQMAAAQDKVMGTFTQADKATIDSNLGVHLLWGADMWHDEPAAV